MHDVRTGDLVTVTPPETVAVLYGRVVDVVYDDPVITPRSSRIIKPVRAARVDLGGRSTVALPDELAPAQVTYPAVPA